jgi:predicted 3-demethylubiquinone-9 3-methyltransferase (glyoxalase superfamily)
MFLPASKACGTATNRLFLFALGLAEHDQHLLQELQLSLYQSSTHCQVRRFVVQKITPCLWFDTEAEAAVNFYVSIFNKSKIKQTARYSEQAAKASGREPGSVMTIVFELNGEDFMALNGGPLYTFSPAISLVVKCDTQEELDGIWDRLCDGGEAVHCGWLKDKYGVSWQIVPTVLAKMMQDPDTERSGKVMASLLQMTKLDIAVLTTAYGSN